MMWCAVLASYILLISLAGCKGNVAGTLNFLTENKGRFAFGRIFDGVGGLSGGGATSKLLINYKEPYRSQILDYLFKPNFGASNQILKVEIGGDSQSTEGTEASHMHVSWEENYYRGYEWWLMKEAKKRNPDIILYGLPWTFPGWLSNGSNNPYLYPTRTATYIIKWILGAKKYHNLTIDFVGIWNERPYNVVYVKTLRSLLDKNGLSHVKIIVGDSDWSPATDVVKDPAFSKALYGIGAHYPGTVSSSLAKQVGKPLWSSEDYSTFNNDVGAGCWARILNQNYVNGLMTSTISWNLIASYYDQLPYKRCSLMTANEPWSGHYILPGPLWVTAHTTQFTKPGWRYLPHGDGVGKLPSGGSYVSLMSPDGKDFTIIIETMKHDHSQCIRPALPAYNVSYQLVAFKLGNVLKSITKLHKWSSQLYFSGGKKSWYFAKSGDVEVANGTFVLSLGVDYLVTLSTLSTAQHGSYGSPPPSQPFPVPYTDNFESYSIGEEPFYLTPQIGSFEVALLPSSNPPNLVMKQTVLQRPVDWCSEPNIRPIAVMGNYSWKSVTAKCSVIIPSVNGTSGAFLATRVDQGGCGAYAAKGIYVWLMKTNQVIVTGDLQRKVVHAIKNLTILSDVRHDITIDDKGSEVAVYINETVLINLSTSKVKPKNGFIGVGTDNFGIAYFDNLDIISATAAGNSDELTMPQLNDLPRSPNLYYKKTISHGGVANSDHM